VQRVMCIVYAPIYMHGCPASGGNVSLGSEWRFLRRYADLINRGIICEPVAPWGINVLFALTSLCQCRQNPTTFSCVPAPIIQITSAAHDLPLQGGPG